MAVSAIIANIYMGDYWNVFVALLDLIYALALYFVTTSLPHSDTIELTTNSSPASPSYPVLSRSYVKIHLLVFVISTVFLAVGATGVLVTASVYPMEHSEAGAGVACVFFLATVLGRCMGYGGLLARLVRWWWCLGGGREIYVMRKERGVKKVD
ncbi:hypothetical protein BC829DRAFT_397193 [Chytridium lagenaria]|nr:hypothetical protein BC829DRAFT_397193 [Chytridium lagenaria]